ncbi:MAG TPA: glycerate kinase, partial [Sphingomonadales bacterium]|nr:glycerate kinase [Sphingomonadales bacterium]
WAIISGGEMTVEVKNPQGKGGRNLEYLTGLAIGLDGEAGISALACDTDGIDGTEDVAGAVIGDDFMKKCDDARLSPAEFLSQNNTYGLFEQLGGFVKTGPTLTNVNDFRVILIEGR